MTALADLKVNLLVSALPRYRKPEGRVLDQYLGIGLPLRV